MTAPSEAATARTLARPTARTWVDVAVLLGLAVLGIIGFQPSFGGVSFLLAGLGGLALGAAIGIGTSVLRLSGLSTLLAAVVFYFLLGPAIAVPGQTLWGVVPTLDALASVAIGTVYGWADIVTLATPVGAPGYIGVVPYAAGWIVALVSTLLAMRWLARRERTAWRLAVAFIAPSALYLGAILIGTDEAYQAGVRGVAFALVALVWLGWRRPLGGVATGAASRLRNRKLTGTAIVVGLAVVAGAGVGFVTAPPQEDRFVLRDEITPPFDPLDYPSPLAGFRYFSKQVTEEVVLEVEGLQPGDRIRLATLDTFTGTLWNVAGARENVDGSGSFELVGRSLPAAPLVTPVERGQVTVTLREFADVWVPSVGYPTDFELLGGAAERSDDLRYNAGTGSMVLTSQLQSGDRYTMDAIVQEVPSINELSGTPIASVELPPAENVPDIVSAKAQEYSEGVTDPAEQLEAIRVALVSTGFLSRGLASDSLPSRAGHGADRVIELLERPQMVGDEEQYASAFALMARSLGFPARVVMGFAPEVSEGGGLVDVTGDDVTAWVEVAFDGVGWVPFNPTPDETDIPQDQEPRPQSEPQPQVRQPPRAESDDDELLSPVELEEQENEDEELPFALPGWVVTLALSILIPAALVLVPALIIGIIKARRLRRRQEARAGHDQAAGAWDELIDRHAELGFAIPARSTRPTVAARLEHQLAELPGADGSLRLRSLATATDTAVFSGREVSSDESAEVWSSTLSAISTAEGAVPRSRRLLSRYRVRWVSRGPRAGVRGHRPVADSVKKED